MSEAANDSELGRSKKSSSPTDHLQHLLNIGWSPNAPLVQKYVAKYGLRAQLAEWEALIVKQKPAAASKK
jgi:hypothetical protein